MHVPRCALRWRALCHVTGCNRFGIYLILGLIHRQNRVNAVSEALECSLSRPASLAQVPRWDHEADIVVVGGGGTPIQRAAGFDDDTEDLYRYLLMAGGPNADTAKARLYADNSLKHFEWLTAQGIEYKNSYIAERCIEPATDDCLIWSGSEEAWPFAAQARPAPRGHCPKFVGMGGGRYVMDVLARRVLEAGVEVHYNTRAMALVTDGRAVHGLVARSEGTSRYLRARRGGL